MRQLNVASRPTRRQHCSRSSWPMQIILILGTYRYSVDFDFSHHAQNLALFGPRTGRVCALAKYAHFARKHIFFLREVIHLRVSGYKRMDD